MINYDLIPGREKNEYGKIIGKSRKVISIVTPFYNGGKTIEDTANSIFNQTYPYFEWIIVDDGSKDEESLKKLDEIAKMDDRIKVYHKENGGPSIARDFGISKCSKESKYVFFIDCDDMMENTMLEVLHWTLETHPDASWSYCAMTNFGDAEFIWEKYLTSKGEKKANVISIASLVRKEDLLEVGCFGIKEKSMYEDWNLWLKLFAKGKKPVRVSTPLFWYRFSNSGEFSRAKENHKNAMKYVKETAKRVDNDCEVYQYPTVGEKVFKPGKFDVHAWETFDLPMYEKTGKKTILFIFPWMVVGGADLFNLELIKRLDKKKYTSIVLTTFPTNNTLRQKFVEAASEVYDMSGFMDRNDYIKFVDYIIKSRNVDILFNSNSTYGYSMIPYVKSRYPKVAVLDYIHSIDLKDPRGGFGRYTKDCEAYIESTYACNEFTTNQIKTMFEKENVETLYIGTDSDKFDPKKFDSDELRSELNIPKENKVITFIARLSEEKRPKLFVKIANELLKNRKDLTFVIAGDGPKRRSVESQINKYKINDNFILLGMASETEKVYAISDVTVNCSRLEGLALTAYESLSMGVPVVSADVGGQKELINDSVGKIVPYKEKTTKIEKEQEIQNYVDAINYCLENQTKLSKNSRKRILEGFSFELMIKKFENIFDNIKSSNIVVPESLALGIYKTNMEFLVDEYEYFKEVYDREHYPELYVKGIIDKDKMWKHPAWRLFVKSPLWKVAKKIVKR